MGVQNSIQRIKNNVTAALAAIEAKGVTVPSGANSDDLEALIAEIESGGGGGGGSGGAIVETGSLTYTTEMDAPGAYKYTFTSPSLYTDDALVVILRFVHVYVIQNLYSERSYDLFLFARKDITEPFIASMTLSSNTVFERLVGIRLTSNYIAAEDALMRSDYVDDIKEWSYIKIK